MGGSDPSTNLDELVKISLDTTYHTIFNITIIGGTLLVCLYLIV
jgi:hypothetical protein